MLTYQYDALNRMTVKVVPERAGLAAAQTRDVHYGYDLRGLPLYARFDSPSGPGIANAYDAFGRLATTTADTDGTARTLAFKYDAASLRARIIHPDLAWFETSRDTLGRPYWLASSDNHTCFYGSWRPEGLPGSQGRCNGASTWVSRDGIGRLNGLGHYYGAGGTGDATWLYQHNAASQIRSLTRDNDAYAWTGHYAVSRAYATNGLNQYSAAVSNLGSASYGYDLNGNLVSEPAPGGGVRTYTYDVENRLVASSAGVTVAYDPLGRLYQITAGNGTITRFLYDPGSGSGAGGDALVGEYNAAGEMTRRYVHWEGADVPIVSYATDSLASPSYLHADHQGSIVAISDATGVTQINRYDEYGIPAATNAGRFQYTGQIWLAELGLYYYKARLYSPTLGRFWQTDPVGYEDQFNLYAYVGNDPVNGTDTSGECTVIDGRNVGVCPMSDPTDTSEQQAAIFNFVEGRLADDTSGIPDIDRDAVRERRMVALRFAQRTVNRTDRAGHIEDVEGEMVEEAHRTRAPIIVTIDPTDSAVVYGRNEGSLKPVRYEESLVERAEHAIVGHAGDLLRHGRGDENSINAENRWRARNNNPFRRIGHGGYAEELRRHRRR